MLRYEITGGPAFLLIEPCDGIFEALRLAREHGVASQLIDRDSDDYEAPPDAVPDPHAIDRIGYEAYVNEVSAAFRDGPTSPEDELREATMAFHLSRLLEQHERVLFVCGLAHAARVRKRLEGPVARPLGRTKRTRRPGLSPAPRQLARSVVGAGTRARSLRSRGERGSRYPPPTKQVVTRSRAISSPAARERMEKDDGERLGAHPIRVALQFARNQAIARGGSPPISSSSPSPRAASLPTILHGTSGISASPILTRPIVPISRSIGSRSTSFNTARADSGFAGAQDAAPRPSLVRSRRKEPTPGAWGDPLARPVHLQLPARRSAHRSLRRLPEEARQEPARAERARVAPFVSGFGDGIDLRETIKNLVDDGRIYVREDQASPGDVGAVCVVFDAEDKAQNRYSWTVTWQGEHEDESDMALYATPPGTTAWSVRKSAARNTAAFS